MFWALLPLITTAAPPLIRFVETLFSHKPKSGGDKIIAFKQLFLSLLSMSGHVTLSTIPDEHMQELNTLLTTVANVLVADMNNRGELTHGYTITAGSSSVTSAGGQ